MRTSRLLIPQTYFSFANVFAPARACWLRAVEWFKLTAVAEGCTLYVPRRTTSFESVKNEIVPGEIFIRGRIGDNTDRNGRGYG